jgi:hypothetical protein
VAMGGVAALTDSRGASPFCRSLAAWDNLPMNQRAGLSRSRLDRCPKIQGAASRAADVFFRGGGERGFSSTAAPE